MRDHLPRIAGVILLVCALFLFILSAAGTHFSIPIFYLFIACSVCGILLVSGLVGTHPVAAKLRREARQNATLRQGPLCAVSEQVFPYAGSSWKRHLVVVICAVMGLGLLCLGSLMVWSFPSSGFDRLLAPMPLWIVGILCLWLSFRYSNMCVRVTPQGITIKSHFRTATMRWEDILSLIAREHHALIVGGFVSTGIQYSLYSKSDKLWFTSQLPGCDQLVSLVAEATGLTWNSI
jgi:hypothetical protein